MGFQKCVKHENASGIHTRRLILDLIFLDILEKVIYCISMKNIAKQRSIVRTDGNFSLRMVFIFDHCF